MDIANTIRTYREKHRMTKAAMGQKLGISGTLIGQYERGRQKPKTDFYLKFKEVFGVNLSPVADTNVPSPPQAAGEPLADLAKANLMLAEANKTLADSHAELVRMITVDAPAKIEVEKYLAKADLLEILAEVLTGKFYPDRMTALSELNKFLIGGEKKSVEGGKSKNVHRLGKD